mmetsp:Transcript_8678/g.12651  ORF Transcript_8678/g.12651 Transcript_8678/m.12651 type:complete len:121 (+) Transcript_8678:203-565(+)
MSLTLLLPNLSERHYGEVCPTRRVTKRNQMDHILAFIAWGFAFWNTGERAARVGIIKNEGQQQQHHHHHHNAVDTLSKKSVFGFPPLLILCLIISVWWVMIRLHLGRSQSRIDIELEKHL